MLDLYLKNRICLPKKQHVNQKKIIKLSYYLILIVKQQKMVIKKKSCFVKI